MRFLGPLWSLLSSSLESSPRLHARLKADPLEEEDEIGSETAAESLKVRKGDFKPGLTP